MSTARFFSAAYGDIRAAIDWYESQRPGLGAEYIEAVDRAIAAVVENPQAFPVVYRDTRRFLVERIPFGLYYRVDSDGVLVVGVMHAAQDPERFRSRLRD